MSNSIVLIGPSGAGKSTVGAMLAEKLDWPHLELDKLRMERYYPELGYDHEAAKKIRKEQGFAALVAHWKPYSIHAVERVLEDFPDQHVISFGAGHSIFEDEAHFARAEKALKPFVHVLLLMPSEDIEESIRILTERLGNEFPDGVPHDILEVNKSFVGHPSNEKLATATIYTAHKTPEDIANAILQHIQPST